MSTCPKVRWPGAIPTTVSLVPSRSIVSTSPTPRPALEPTTIPSSAPTGVPRSTGGATKLPGMTPNRARSTGPRLPRVNLRKAHRAPGECRVGLRTRSEGEGVRRNALQSGDPVVDQPGGKTRQQNHQNTDECDYCPHQEEPDTCE